VTVGMRGPVKRIGWLVTLVVAVAVLVVLPLLATASDYKAVAVQSASDAMSEARTVRLALEGELAGKTLDPYVDTVFWQAHDTLSTAVKDLAKEEVPDQAAAEIQARVSPLLAKTVQAVGTAELAVDSDDGAIRAAIHDLEDVAERLQSFLESSR
jgi:hypothetical protein